MTDADYVNMSAFSCGEPALDAFFRAEVRECVEKHYLAAYCALLESGEIVGAFTLMNDALMIAGESEKTDFFDDLRLEADADRVDFFKLQTSYPAINIDLVAETFAGYRQAGCQFITVDSLNNSHTARFYQSNGFFFQTNKDFFAATRRMYRIL